MSSFSSVVHKTGNSIKPKSQPRRNVSRRVQHLSPPVTDVDSDVTANVNIEDVRPNTRARQERTLQQPETIQQSSNISSEPADKLLPSVSSDSAVRVSESPRTRARRANASASTPEIVLLQITGQQNEGSETRPVPKQRATPVSLAPSGVDASNTSSCAVTEYPSADETNDRPRKRRRLTPLSTSSPAPARTSSVVPIDPVINGLQQSQDRANDEIQPAADLIQLATQRAASVSTLANNIDVQTRARNLQHNSSTNVQSSHEPTANVSVQRLASDSKTKKHKKKTAAEQAAEVIANVIGNIEDSPRRRDQTPEDADKYELEPDEVTMGELTRDRKLGKKSQLEEDMQREWPDIVRRRKEARDLALENAQKGRRKAFGSAVDVPLQATVALGPRTEVRNGRIVVIEESRQIDRNGALEQAAVLDAENVREDKFYYKRVNQNTVGMKAYAGRKFRWDQESTEQFFRGLQMFGTDFLMIANMFPGLDRKQIKKKFIREENADKMKIRQALAEKIPIDLDEYAKMTDTTLQDPDDLQAEIDAEEERLKEEDQQRRIREGFVNMNPSDSVVPTTEGEDAAIAEGSVENESRFATIAEEIMAPKKRQRKTGSTLRKRGPKAGRRPAEGIEEVLGSIDEVRV